MKFEFLSILVFIQLFESIKSVNHWKVTENGLIEANKNSIYTLQKPNDLAIFMKQTERSSHLDVIKDLLDINIDENMNMNFNLKKIKENFLNFESDCLNTNFELSKIQFYETYLSNISKHDDILLK
jgi:hypothetical protein